VKILLSVDDDPTLPEVLAALEWSIELSRWREILVVHVVPQNPLFPLGADAQRAARGEQLVNEVVERLSRSPLPIRRFLAKGDPAQEIVHIAEKACAELIVLGAWGEKRDFLMGSVAHRVVALAPTDILVVRGSESHGRRRDGPFRALLAVDGSRGSEAAIDAFSRKLRSHSASIRLVHVLEQPKAGVAERQDSKAHEVLEWARQALERRGLRSDEECRRGDPAGQIVEAARESVTDVIVVGSRGHSAIREMVLGGVTQRVLRHAPCNVLCARGFSPQSSALPRRWLSETWEPGAGMA
jgi:nucleotide-binding universal stress UspA family protein